jgi:hypothetical protein
LVQQYKLHIKLQMENKIKNVPISQWQSSNFVLSNSNQDGNDVADGDADDDADDADDEDNSSIPSHFVTSNNFVPPPFISSLPSRAFSPSVLSVSSSTVVVSSISSVPSILTTSSVPAVTVVSAVPKFQLTSEQTALPFSDIIGGADT